MRHLIIRKRNSALTLLCSAVLVIAFPPAIAHAQNSRGGAPATRQAVGITMHSQASGGPHGYHPRAYNYQVGAVPSQIVSDPFEQMNTPARLAQEPQSPQPIDWREQQQTARYMQEERQLQAHASPDAPDQSERLRMAKDRDAILHNFQTMYVDARDAQYFGSDQLKAALQRNKGFEALNIRIVDDPHVADTVLKVGYTFAWDYPFELRHQNTTIVLLAGKGQGPFSGPLGAADVARQFVNIASGWRKPAETRK
jgi:hypothetical protein